jgi:hypothetical protein
MIWVVGLDEAGYGPILGPLLQTAIAVQLPGADRGGFASLQEYVCQADAKDKKRLLVDDSKAVHSGKDGLKKLEAGLVGLLGLTATTFGAWLQTHALPFVVQGLMGEAWYDPDLKLPLYEHKSPDLRPVIASLGIETLVVGVNLVCTPGFNRIVAGSGTKATVLSIGLTDLLRATRERLPGAGAVHVLCDKQGGRNFYAPLLQGAFADGWVVTEAEGATESRYRVEGIGREMTVTFRPRADAESLPVALASMTAKYLREVSMMQFNAYWQKHQPGLAPTAGYPQDGERFYRAIRETMARLKLNEDAVRRCK